MISGCNLVDFTSEGISVRGVITEVYPNWISRQGSEKVTIKGDFSLVKKPDVKIDGSVCTNVQKVSDTEITCTSPSSSQIKNAKLQIFMNKKISAEYPVKFVGVLGQPSTYNNLKKDRGLRTPYSVRVIGSSLYITDFGHKRIVGLNDASNLSDRNFDFSLFLPSTSVSGDQHTIDDGNIGSRDFEYSGGNFIVADTDNHRVLIYEGFPSPTNRTPKVILGQPDLSTRVTNNGGVSAKSLNNPVGVRVIDGKLFVSDTANNRVLVWNSVPTTNFQDADYVLGQPDFTTTTANTGGRAANRLSAPQLLQKIGNKLFISDFGNSRILVWDSIPASNLPANSVIGQADFTTKGVTASSSITLGAAGFAFSGTSLFLADFSAHRILVFKNIDLSTTIPNGLSADIVLGQPDFTTTTTWLVSGKPTSQSLFNPYGVEVYSGKLLVADANNHRILVYNHLPSNTTTDQHQPADDFIGQESFSLNGAARSLVTGGRDTPLPSTIGLYEGRLLINSESVGRISVFNSDNNSDYKAADFVLGQLGVGEDDLKFNRGLSNPTSSTLGSTYQMVDHGGILYVSEVLNNRVLGWNTLTGVNGQAADLVLGQADFNSRVTGATASNMNTAIGMDVVDSHLVVADRSNHRFLIYDPAPTVSFTAASSVVGQANFTSNSANGGSTINANSFSTPNNSTTWRGKYVVADQGNRRVLVFSSFASFLAKDPAESIFGQDSMTTFDSVLTSGPTRINTHTTVRVIDDVLYVPDPFNNRILIFDNLPTGPIFSPTRVWGQKLLTSTSKEMLLSGFSAQTFNTPVGIYGFGSQIYIADYQNNRVIVLPKD